MYTQDQKIKNEELVETEMKNASSEDRNSVLRECSQHWANDDEAKAIIERKKSEIALRATPEEMDEAFKYARV